jgi:hypothetical protein
MCPTLHLRITPLPASRLLRQRQHDLRAHVPHYADRSRTAKNSVLIAPPIPSSVLAEANVFRRYYGLHLLRAGSAVAYAAVIEFSPDAQAMLDQIDLIEQDRLIAAVASQIASTAGTTVIGLVVHRDEAALHAHLLLRGYDLRTGRAVRISHKDTHRLQELASEVLPALLPHYQAELITGPDRPARVTD